jgi:uncharacterized membrane protein YvlD (DUF360 family)
VMLKVAAFFTPNFEVRTWTAALIGAVFITIISTVLHWLLDDRKREQY